jgi:hypothetical protein
MDGQRINERSKDFVHDLFVTLEQCVAEVFRAGICYRPLVEARIDLHLEGYNQQDASYQ